MSVEDIVNKTGISDVSYKRLEEGKVSMPNVNTLYAIAKSLEVSIDYLLGRTDKREVNR